MTFSSWRTSAASAGRAVALRLPGFAKRKLFYLPVLALMLVGGSYLAFAKPEAPAFETATVTRADVVQVVSETGTVRPAEEAGLSFTASGRIQSVSVKEGQHVTRGQLLATLDSSAEYANLLSAQARLRQQQASYQSADASHGLTQSQQDQLVESAKNELISGGLQAYLVKNGNESDPGQYVPPTITGTYTCTTQGTYRIELYQSSAQSGASFKYHGLEEGTASASSLRPVPLGSCGLYIQFPSGFSQVAVWDIPVPNTRSTSYQSRLDAYNAAVENRNRVIADSHTTPVLGAQIEEARAAVLAAQAALAQTRLVAPFSGTVTSVDAVRGNVAAPGASAVGLISDNAYEISVDVPEDDIGELTVGDTAQVTFDAYDSAPVKASVSYVAPAAKNDSGGALFKVTLQFAERDERIRAGLSADVDITTASRAHVLAVPIRAVVDQEGRRFVRVMTSANSYREAEVHTGLSGGGMIEIVSGLSEGDRIITFANDKALATLTKE